MTTLVAFPSVRRTPKSRTTGLPWVLAILAMAGGGVVGVAWLLCRLFAAYGASVFVVAGALALPAVLALGLLGARMLSAERARALARARILNILVEANRFFALRPSEAAIRQHLAEAICDLTGRGAAISGPDGALDYRAGAAARWRGGLEAELAALSRRAANNTRVDVAPLGVFRARTDALNSRVFGAAVWVRPAGSGSLVREADQYVAMLIELASAAIVQCRKDEGLPGGLAPLRSGRGRRLGLV